MKPDLGIEPGPHWWEASALTTAPSLHTQQDEQQDGLPHSLSLFTRERIASKIKDIMKKYKKAVLKYSCIMQTARPFHNHINESVIVVTSGLNINRCVSLSVDVVRRIFSGLLDWYVSAIYCSHTLGESMIYMKLVN